ncbi:MAG: hypothetical protein EXS05_03985 [Planctomycetaceae bacterium]|nr:hypothetical protein [Planctomycetaceae bacterium]
MNATLKIASAGKCGSSRTDPYGNEAFTSGAGGSAASDEETIAANYSASSRKTQTRHEADEDILAGKVKTFGSVDEILGALRQPW